MNLEIIKNPIAKSLSVGDEFPGIPEITNVSYDLWYLQIALWFNNKKPPIYVRFDGILGFRLLDEGDLLEFWSDNRPEGWLWQIEKGGWLDLETFREGFLSGKTEKDKIKEYLILGINDCLSVMAYDKPEIFKPEY